MSERSCGHCEAIGRGAQAICTLAGRSVGGIAGTALGSATGKACYTTAKAVCEKVSHCSTTNPAY